jgi:hypothetical protein
MPRSSASTPASGPAIDLVGEPATRASLLTLREDIADIQRRVEEAERSAQALPHREKYRHLVARFLRGLVELHLDLVEQVEREFSAETNGRPVTGDEIAVAGD